MTLDETHDLVTRFAIIRPSTRTVTNEDHPDYKSAMQSAGLDGVDFGTVANWHDGSSLSIIVYEWGLVKGNPAEYFALEGRLYNGNAVLFKADLEGETTDLPEGLAAHMQSECTHLSWFANPQEVEMAINDGRVTRPQSSINGQVTWEWRP